METRTIQEVRIYVLVLNTFRTAESGEIVALNQIPMVLYS